MSGSSLSGEEERVKASIDKFRQICRETFNVVWAHPDAWIFHRPVYEADGLSQAEKVSYSVSIKDPMDLRTIKQNLPLFPTPSEFHFLMMQIFSNCEIFNRPGQDAYEMGRAVKELYLKKWASVGEESFSALKEAIRLGYEPDMSRWERWQYRPPSYDLIKNKAVLPNRPNGKIPPFIYVSSVEGGNQPVAGKEASKKSEGVGEDDDWRKLIVQLFFALKTSKDAVWFDRPVWKFSLLPVGLVKSYYDKIARPMDLDCVEKNLCNYSSPNQFYQDIKLIIDNCMQFNQVGDSVYSAGISFWQEFKKMWKENGRFFDKIRLLVSEEKNNHQVRIEPERPPAGFFDAKREEKPVMSISLAPLSPEPLPALVAAEKSVLSASTWKFIVRNIFIKIREFKDKNGTRISWIFEKPIFKYHLDFQVKLDYYDKIRSPMDFSVIKANLDKYPSPHEFYEDIMLVFKNCKTFNKPGEDSFIIGSDLEDLFLILWNESKSRIDSSYAMDIEGIGKEAEIARLDKFSKDRIRPEPFIAALQDDTLKDVLRKKRWASEIDGLVNPEQTKLKKVKTKKLSDKELTTADELKILKTEFLAACKFQKPPRQAISTTRSETDKLHRTQGQLFSSSSNASCMTNLHWANTGSVYVPTFRNAINIDESGNNQMRAKRNTKFFMGRALDGGKIFIF